jgi:hypothetical protein
VRRVCGGGHPCAACAGAALLRPAARAAAAGGRPQRPIQPHGADHLDGGRAPFDRRLVAVGGVAHHVDRPLRRQVGRPAGHQGDPRRGQGGLGWPLGWVGGKRRRRLCVPLASGRPRGRVLPVAWFAAHEEPKAERDRHATWLTHDAERQWQPAGEHAPHLAEAGKRAQACRPWESSGSWCIAPKAMAFPACRGRLSSTSRRMAAPSGSQRSTSVNPTFPRASGSHRARLKQRWKALLWRQPGTSSVPTTPPPAATATPVTGCRPGHGSHPATRWQNVW